MPTFTQVLRSSLVNPDVRAPIERLAIPAYTILTLWACVIIAVISLSSFSWNGAQLNTIVLVLCTYLVGGMILRRFGLRISGALEAFGLIALASMLATTSTALLSATSFPMTDEFLINADRLLGFDWLHVHDLVAQHPWQMQAWTAIYHTISWQPVLLFAILCMIGREDRCWTMLTAWMLGLVLTCALFTVFPAEAAFNHHNVAQPNGATTANFLPVMEALRDGSLREINRSTIQGMVTFPSFHAAAGVYFAWAAAGVRWLRIPFILLNVAMILSAIPVGGHYLVDVIGGCLLAAATIAASIRIQRLAPKILDHSKLAVH